MPLDASADESAGEAALVLAAVDARTRAHAQYSGFKVGAALETSDGEVVTGCNIENATYGLTLCAERVALVKALSDGREIFTRIAVVADTPDPTPPCGPCRQLLWEYCGDIDIILANLSRSDCASSSLLRPLLPMPASTIDLLELESLMLPTIDWQDDVIVMVDQRKLPSQELYVRCRSSQEVARAIRTMVIRGAPAIGVAAAMGSRSACGAARRREPGSSPSSFRRSAT